MITKTPLCRKAFRKKPPTRPPLPSSPSRRQKRSAPAVLEVEDIQFYRGKTSILRNLNWQVRPGEHWAILGPNGSGKTSLLNILLGYQMASSGTVRLLGREFGRHDWRQLRNRIGYVGTSISQGMKDSEPALESVISGKKAMIGLWGRIQPGERRQAAALLRQLRCAYLEEREWGFLSQGEKQRVLIARALMAKARLLVLDEPCAGLDPLARESFLTWLNRFRGKKIPTTFVLVTHHVEELVPLFTHLLILKQGKVVAAGPFKKILRSGVLSEAFGRPLKIRTRGKNGRPEMMFLKEHRRGQEV